MTNQLKVMTVCACMAAIVNANAQTSVLTKIQNDYKLSPIESAAAIVIAGALGIKIDGLVNTSRTTREPYSVLGPALVISRNSDRDLAYVLKHKPKGQGWGNVAKNMGMHPGDFNKMRVQGGSFDAMCWKNMLNTKYSFPEKDYDRARKQGLSDMEVVLAVVMANGKTTTAFDKAMKDVVAKRPKKVTPPAAGPGKGKGKGGG